jgi:hypothetical protein
MSSENERRLREIFERRRTHLHDQQLASEAVAAKQADFVRRYLAHRDGVLMPTLRKLKGLVREYGHELLIDDAATSSKSENADCHRVQATLLLQGYDETYKTACPQVGFAADLASRQITVYASDRVPHKDGASGQQTTRTIEELSSEAIEEMFLAVVQRAFAH